MVDPTIHNTTTYLEEIAKGNGKTEFEILILQGLELIHVGKGTLRCRLVVTERVAVNITHPSILFFFHFFFFVFLITRDDSQGEDGSWNAGVITAVMDSIGASAVYSAGGGLHISVDLNSSFYSTAKIHVRLPYPHFPQRFCYET